MIKLSIKDKSEPQEKKEFEGILNLEQSPDGDVNLMMRSTEDNFNWFILRLKTDGTFHRVDGLPNNIGLQVDDEGSIIESEENQNEKPA